MNAQKQNAWGMWQLHFEVLEQLRLVSTVAAPVCIPTASLRGSLSPHLPQHRSLVFIGEGPSNGGEVIVVSEQHLRVTGMQFGERFECDQCKSNFL